MGNVLVLRKSVAVADSWLGRKDGEKRMVGLSFSLDQVRRGDSTGAGMG